MKKIDLSISIVNYNTKDLLEKCLNSVFKNTYGLRFEVFVVDNASKDKSVEIVSSKYPLVSWITNKNNEGFAKANNQALKKARGKYFLLLNSDTEIIGNALKKIVDFMENNQRCGICCPQLFYPDGKLQKSYSNFVKPWERSIWEYRQQLTEIKLIIKNKFGKKQINQDNHVKKSFVFPKQPIEINRPRGACFLIRMEAIKDVGPLDERFFMYDEEVDWALRVKNKGWSNYFVPDAHVIHMWGGSTKNRWKLLDDIHTQSDYKFHFKHYGIFGFLIVWLGHLIGAFLSFILGIYYFIFKSNSLDKSNYKKQFDNFKRLIRKMFLLKDIRPLNE